jgi:hypothetical protein
VSRSVCVLRRSRSGGAHTREYRTAPWNRDRAPPGPRPRGRGSRHTPPTRQTPDETIDETRRTGVQGCLSARARYVYAGTVPRGTSPVHKTLIR